MLFIALVKFKKNLSKEIIAENLKDIEADTKGQVRYLGIYWTLGRYDTVVLFEAPNEKVAINMALKRAGPDGHRDSCGRASGRRESSWTGLTWLFMIFACNVRHEVFPPIFSSRLINELAG